MQVFWRYKLELIQYDTGLSLYDKIGRFCVGENFMKLYILYNIASITNCTAMLNTVQSVQCYCTMKDNI